MTAQRLDLVRLRKATQGTCWDLSNEVLYRLCQEYPRHEKEDEILAKVCLIGRAYSAAIERRKKALKIKGERFFTEVVGPKILAAKIDTWLSPLYGFKQPSTANCSQIIAAHKKLTDLFRHISGLEKRSLASKYLHFHFPQLYYIYDSRAARAIAGVAPRTKEMPALHEHDSVYAKYFVRCMGLVTRIEREHGVHLSPRRLDDYLLEFS